LIREQNRRRGNRCEKKRDNNPGDAFDFDGPLATFTRMAQVSVELTVDGQDYHVLTDCVPLIKDVEGLTCEIGLRGGGASAMIMQHLAKSGQSHRTHIAIDPYGNIEYQWTEQLRVRLDYTNDLRNQAIIAMHYFSQATGVNFIFFNLEDTEFFVRYANGVPIYSEHKIIVNKYALVYFDGPHALAPLVDEVKFFNERTAKGAMYVFDDVADYDHQRLADQLLTPFGFQLHARTQLKASYVKI